MKSQGTAHNVFRESYIFWIFKSHLKHERSKKALLIFHLHIMLVKNGEYGVFFKYHYPTNYWGVDTCQGCPDGLGWRNLRKTDS